MMKTKVFFFVYFLFSVFVSGQVGVVSNINPNLKHIHAEVGSNIETKSAELLNYSLNPFIESLFQKNNLPYQPTGGFDFKFMDDNYIFRPNKVNNYLDDFCKENGLSGLIIFYRNSTYGRASAYKNLTPLKFDYGILSDLSKTKRRFFNTAYQ